MPMPRFTTIVPTRLRVLACAATLASGVGASAVSVVHAGAAAKHHTAILVSTKDSTSLGEYLVTTRGFTLYTYTLDTATKSACTGLCATEWPPLLVPKGAKLSGLVQGVKASKLGKVSRGHGKFQLTYLGKPLYRFAGDKSPGQTGGQGFENAWLVALVTPKAPAPAATPVTASPPSTTAPVSHASSSTESSRPTSPPSTSPAPTTPTTTTPPTTAPPPTTTVPPPVSGGGYGY
jgi:predicted lipoprotein with Yx(FWY)xxD motif